MLWCDVVLGVSWLRTLGKVMMDWKDLTMQFHHKGQLVTLRSGGRVTNGCLNSFLDERGGKRGVDGWCTQLELKQEAGEVQKNVMKVLESFP
jgi:hypothetical protein